MRVAFVRWRRAHHNFLGKRAHASSDGGDEHAVRRRVAVDDARRGEAAGLLTRGGGGGAEFSLSPSLPPSPTFVLMEFVCAVSFCRLSRGGSASDAHVTLQLRILTQHLRILTGPGHLTRHLTQASVLNRDARGLS